MSTHHPKWFTLNPEGPHKKSGGLGLDGFTYEFYCAKDGQVWPCEDEKQRIAKAEKAKASRAG